MEMLFATSTKSNFITNRDSSIKILFPIIFFITILLSREDWEIIFVVIISLFISIVAQGVNSTIKTIWFLKIYLITIIGFLFLFSEFELRLDSLLFILKLIAIILAFTSMNRSLTPDQLTNGLIKLRIPSRIAWTIGIAFRQAIFTIDEIDIFMQLQRLRAHYYDSSKFSKIKYRINETINLLTALLGRSVIVSSSLTDTLISRGFTEPHSKIIMNVTKLNIVDIVFLIIVGIIPFVVVVYL